MREDAKTMTMSARPGRFGRFGRSGRFGRFGRFGRSGWMAASARIGLAAGAAALLTGSFFGAAAAQDVIPDRPEELTFPDFAFDAPLGDDYRREIAGGVPVYVVEDHTLPLVQVGVSLRVGDFLDPPDRIGLAGLTAAMMREGGTTERTPAELDERVEFLAVSLSTSSGEVRSRAVLGAITPVFDEALDLFFEVLRAPGFDEERFAIQKQNLLEDMKQRNDDPGALLSREWGMLVFGADHFLGRRMTSAHADAIGVDDLRRFHRRYWRPENMVFSVAGDVDVDSVLAALGERIADWPDAGGDAAAGDIAWPPPDVEAPPRPGVYHVEKDIPQGRVRIGNLAPRWEWDNPDRAAIQVMDHILGASGFTSRIMRRVRSDEGLAYGAGGSFSFNATGPSGYSLGFQSKSETVALAARISLEEVRRMREEPVSEEELDLARRSLIDTFPRRFESARARAGLFATDVFLGRDHDYWGRWRAEVEAVTADDVLRVANRYLQPDRMVMLVVGKWDDIGPGDPEGRASMADLFDGDVTFLPERDPVTLEPVPPPAQN